MLIGPVAEPALELATALMLRYTRRDDSVHRQICVTQSGRHWMIPIRAGETQQSALTL